MNDPRPAMISARPPDSRSSVANCWNTRTGSSELITETALVSRMRSVRAAAAASTTAGAETVKSGRWCSPTPNTSRPDLVGQLDLLQQVAQPLLRRDRVRRDLAERVDAELHRSELTKSGSASGRAA